MIRENGMYGLEGEEFIFWGYCQAKLLGSNYFQDAENFHGGSLIVGVLGSSYQGAAGRIYRRRRRVRQKMFRQGVLLPTASRPSVLRERRGYARYVPDRHSPGAFPNSLLNARLNAASDS